MLIHRLLLWLWRWDGTMSAQPNSDDETQKGRRTESDKMNQSDEHSRGRDREQKAEHLKSRTTEEIPKKIKADKHRKSDPAEAGNH